VADPPVQIGYPALVARENEAAQDRLDAIEAAEFEVPKPRRERPGQLTGTARNGEFRNQAGVA
jgi:hypothetical protein